MTRPRFHAVLLLLAGIAGAVGCNLDYLHTRERYDRGLAIVLPGIEGKSIWNISLAEGLNDGGVDCAIEIHEWGTPVPGGFLINLTDQRRNMAEAQRLVARILRYSNMYPGRQVHLIGHSGGAGLAILAVEDLPEDTPVETVTLLAAALSPEYDLRPALRRTRGSIYNCYSARDAVLLGAGTSLAGTIDRKYGESAGKVGFRLPEESSHEDDRLFTRLKQRAWEPGLARLGNDGGHFGWTDRRFAKVWIAPVLRRSLDRPSMAETVSPSDWAVSTFETWTSQDGSSKALIGRRLWTTSFP